MVGKRRTKKGSSVGGGASTGGRGAGLGGGIFAGESAPVHREEVGRIIERHGRNAARLIPILQDVQAAFGYLPEKEMRLVAGELGVPLNRIYHVVTFYKAFRLNPPGRHEIKLCTGTACHVRGAEGVRDAIGRVLGIAEGETTRDSRFSFETVHCLGCCGMAPVVMIDGEIHGKVGFSLDSILERYE